MSMRRWAAAAFAAALLAAAPAAAAAGGREGAVGGWIDVELAEIGAHQTNPPRAARALALVSVAMRDAADVPARHRRSAVDAAAVTVLSHIFPDRAEAFENLAMRPRTRAGQAARRIRFERASADQAEFLTRHLLPAGDSSV